MTSPTEAASKRSAAAEQDDARRADYVRALKVELAGYEVNGKTDRADAVRAELKRVEGAKAADKAPKGRRTPANDQA